MGNLSPALPTTQSKRATVTLLRVSLGPTMIYLRCTHDELWRFSPPGSPAKFLPAVRTTVDSEGKIVVSIRCVSEASPRAAVLWTNGHRALTNGTTYQIISDATQLNIHHYNVSNFLLNNYTCICHNPLGSQTRQTRLKGNFNPTGGHFGAIFWTPTVPVQWWWRMVLQISQYFQQGSSAGLSLGPIFSSGLSVMTHF